MAGTSRGLGRKVDYGQLAGRIRDRIAEDTAEPLDILRTYYYDCQPFRSRQPTLEEVEQYDRYQRFADALSHLPRFEVRLGRLQLQGRRPDGSQIFRQKQVDLLLGLDLALLSGKNRVSHVALVAGDGDFVPLRCGLRSRKAPRSGSSTARAPAWAATRPSPGRCTAKPTPARSWTRRSCDRRSAPRSGARARARVGATMRGRERERR